MVLIGLRPSATSMLQALEMVVGPQKNFLALDIDLRDDDMETRRDELIHCVKKVNSGDGVIVFSDMFGGTPSNLAISIMDLPDVSDVEVIAGFNLPMLIKAASMRDGHQLQEVITKSRDAGRKYIYIASNILRATERTEEKAPPNELEELRKTALQLATDTRVNLLKIEKLVEALALEPAVTPGIGHNNPPERTIINPVLLKEGITAIEVIEEELPSEKPRSKVLEICLFVLERVKNGVIALIKWLGYKADKFLDNLLDSSGKAAGTAAAALIGAEAALGRLGEDMDKLIAMIHGLLKLLSF